MAHVHIVSELVANVMNVSVSVGDTVAAGDEIVLEESMKMEIPVLTEMAGRIVEVKVQPGDVVQEGEILAIIQTA